jgi:hypothetical protein
MYSETKIYPYPEAFGMITTGWQFSFEFAFVAMLMFC